MPQVVTGLLRIEAYVQGITVASFPAAADDFTERAVVRRLGRQHLLGRADQLFFGAGEPVSDLGG